MIVNIEGGDNSMRVLSPASVTLKLLKASIAEYSSPVWSPLYKSHIELIERIQRNFTRYAMHYPPLNYSLKSAV